MKTGRTWAVVAGALGIAGVATVFALTHTDKDATIVANVAIISIAVMVIISVFLSYAAE